MGITEDGGLITVAVEVEELLTVYLGDEDDVVELAVSGGLVALQRPRLPRVEPAPHRVRLVGRHPLGDAVQRVVRVQARLNVHTCARSNVQRVLCHGGLVGVDDVEGLFRDEALEDAVHLSDLVAGDDGGRAREGRLHQRAGVPQPRAAHAHGVHGPAEGLQVRHVLGPVILPYEGDQGHVVLLRQLSQHVVGADLGPGIQGIGQNLGQK